MLKNLALFLVCLATVMITGISCSHSSGSSSSDWDSSDTVSEATSDALVEVAAVSASKSVPEVAQAEEALPVLSDAIQGTYVSYDSDKETGCTVVITETEWYYVYGKTC